MRRYLFHIHLLGMVKRDHAGSFHISDSQAVAFGRVLADGIAENERHRSVVVTVERAGGLVLARVTATKAMPPWQSAGSQFEHAWRELTGTDTSERACEDAGTFTHRSQLAEDEQLRQVASQHHLSIGQRHEPTPDAERPSGRSRRRPN